MPTEKAHGYQITKMCEALASAGADVSLVVPTRKNKITEDVHSYFEVRNNFSFKKIPAFDAFSFFGATRLSFYIQSLSFLWALRKTVVPQGTIVITRNSEVVWWYGRRGYRVFYDAHNYPERGAWLLKWLLKKATGIIANSEGTASVFRRSGFKNILAVPNGVDLSQFTDIKTPERSALGLPAGRIAMYVGHLYEWKGADVVVDAARHTKDKDLSFVFVGGTEEDVARYREKTKDLNNILFLGYHQRSEIPAFIKSANVLLLPNIPSSIESISYTSPIKMFEYMASGVPIVASDLPSIREVLNENNSILVKADDPIALLTGIARAFEVDAGKVASRAKEQAKQYTWDARAYKILEFIKK